MLNFKQIKKELSNVQIIKLLEALGSELYQQNDNEIIFYSCCHHLNCIEHKPKLYYYENTHSFFCYSCSNAFDIYSLVQERWNLEGKEFTFISIVQWIFQILDLNYDNFQRINPVFKEHYSWRELLGRYDKLNSVESQLTIWDKRILNDFDEIYPLEWINEGISIKTMKMFQIKYYSLLNQTIIPCYDEQNNLIGIRVRNWKPVKDKYNSLITVTNYQEKNTDLGTDFKFSTNHILYGMNLNKYAIESKKMLILVESEKAVMKSTEWYEHNSITVAMFGGKLNEKRKRMILEKDIAELVIVPDYDYNDNKSWQKWLKKQRKLGDMFKNFCKVSIVMNENNLVPYKDNAFDIAQKQFEYLFQRRLNMYE